MKKQMRILLMSLCILSGFIARAENKLTLCTDYDPKGNPVNAYPTWKIHKTGNFMYILYKSNSPITDSLYIILEKNYSRKDTAYYEYDHYYLVPDTSKKFAVNKYIFNKPGNYRISVFEKNTEQLLQSYTTSMEYTDEEYQEPFFTDTWYYNQTEMRFYEGIIGDTLIGRSDVFKSQPGGKKIMIYIGQPDKTPLKTEHLILKLYSKENDRLVTTRSYHINPKWSWTYVSVNIDLIGKYSIEMYNEDDLFISKADLEIK